MREMLRKARLCYAFYMYVLHTPIIELCIF